MDSSRDQQAPTRIPPGAKEPLLPAAVDAAAGDAALRRVSELERQLVYERDQNKARLRQVSEHLTVLRERMEEMRVRAQERQELRQRVRELEARVGLVEAERDRLAAEIEKGVRPPDIPLPGAEVIGRLSELERTCEAQESELAGARSEVTSLEHELAAAQEAGALADEQLRALRGELAGARESLAQALSELERARSAVAEAVPVLPEELAWEDEDGQRSGAVDALPAADALPLRTGEMTDFEELPVYDRQEEPAAIVPEDLQTMELSGAELESAIRARQPEPGRRSGARGTGRGRAASDDQRTTTAAAAPSPAALARIAARKRFPDISGLRFERPVAQGPPFAIFEAREVSSRRPVTVRVLCGEHAEVDELGIDALLLARHPNLVSALSFGVTPRGPHVVFERVTGETLEEWIGRVGAVPEHVALGVGLQAARALRKAAFHEVVHGDLSPRSVLIESTGRVRVDGVGLHRLRGKSASPPRDPRFAAPEVVRGEGGPGVAADMYALAALLFFLVTGKAPFEGDLEQVRKRQKSATFPDPRQRGGKVGEEFVAVLLGCGSSDPAARPKAWEQVLERLETLLPGEEPEPSASLPHSGVGRLVAEHPIAVAVAACVPLLALGLGLKLLLG